MNKNLLLYVNLAEVSIFTGVYKGNLESITDQDLEILLK